MNKNLLAGIGAVLVLALGLAIYFQSGGPLPGRPGSPRPEDPPRPDALLITQSLADLPRDLSALPLFQEVLTEDWFFYYEQNDRRLSLEGTLRRIAFEHELSLEEQVLAHVFGTPARLALWKGPDGTLSRFVLVLDRGGLLRTLEWVAKVALDDAQLKPAGTLTLGGAPLAVYELRYSPRRSLFFLSQGSRLWVASERALLVEPEDPAGRLVEGWLGAPDPGAAMAAPFELDAGSGRHRLALSARYLSFGYQRLFPALDALRLDFDQGQWSTALRTRGPVPPARGLWQALPAGAALCAALPLDPERLAALLGRVLEEAEARALIQALEPPAALCWYADAPPHAPLAAIRTRGQVPEETLKRLFAAHIGTHEAGVPVAGQPGETQYLPPFSVSETRAPGGLILRREVSARYGSRPSAESPNAPSMWSRQYFPVTLARHKDLLLFSPHGALVDQALASLEKRYPALADRLPADAELSLLAYPAGLTRLARAAVEESLASEPQETLFQASLAARLWPALDKIQGWRAYGLRTPQAPSGWSPAQWLPLPGP